MSTSSAKAPNGRSGHQSRVSTSSIPLSFAYGAPALPPQNGSSSHIDAQHSEDEQESNLSGSQRAGSEVSGSSRRESAPASSSTVTGNNAAESRYAKYRKHQQNGSSSSNQISSNVPYNPASHSHTSVNIATAFLNAQRDHQSQFDHSEQSFDLDDTHDSGLADESLQVNLPSSLISSSKGKQSKRKRVASTVGGSESGSSAEDSTSRKQKAKKRKSKAIVEEDDAEEDAETEVNTGSQTEFRKPTTPARKGKPRRKSVKDPSYRPGHSEEEEDSDETTASHSKSSKKRQQPRYSTVTDGSKTPRVLGAYPTPGVQRWQFGDDSSLHDGDNPDSSSNRSATFRLDPPDPRDDASSSNYELEAEHVRAREEAASRSQNVANVVLGNPTPHQQSSANAAGRSLPKPRREVRASGQTGLSIPASQTAHRNRDLGFKPPASDSDGFGPGQQSGESLHAAGLKAGNAVRNALFWLFYPLNIALHLFKSSYLKLSVMQWSTIFQGAAIVMFLAVLIGLSFCDHPVSL